MDLSNDSIGEIIQLSVAPVFLLAGIGAFLNVMAGRLARIVDRTRQLKSNGELDKIDKTEIKLLSQRARFIHISISFCNIAALMVCFVIIGLFTSYFAHINAAGILSSLFILTMMSLVTGISLLQCEVFLAIKWLRIVKGPHL